MFPWGEGEPGRRIDRAIPLTDFKVKGFRPGGTPRGGLAAQYRVSARRLPAHQPKRHPFRQDLAGLAEGDVVTAINGTEVRTSDVLRNMIAMMRPGTTVDLEVMKHTGKTVIKAKLGELPGDTSQPTMKQRRIR